LGQLVDAIATAIRGRVDVRQGRAQSIERSGPGFRVRVDGDWIEARRVVVASEAHAAAPLVSAMDPRLGELLSTIPYSSSMTVALGYRAADLNPAPIGFGFLVPKKERRRMVACTWVGTKFSHRVPDGTVVARCFLGGMDDAGVLDESDERVLAAVTAELAEIAQVCAQPYFNRIFRWPRSMAQYTVGHPQRLAELETRAANLPGFYLAGNAYQGIGIPDCIRMGHAAAAKILTS
jgi:oxygen-dependent protoporphyrinogen oxidase